MWLDWYLWWLSLWLPVASPYDVLELQPGATQAEVKRAYRRLSMVYHPDRPGGNVVKFQELQAAYKALTTPVGVGFGGGVNHAGTKRGFGGS